MKEKDLEEIGIIGDKPYLIRNETLSNDVYRTPFKSSRTDGERLKEHGIDTLDKMLEECILISNKQSKLPKSIRDLVVKYSLEAYKELTSKAMEIKKESKLDLDELENRVDEALNNETSETLTDFILSEREKESLENNTKEDDRQEQ